MRRLALVLGVLAVVFMALRLAAVPIANPALGYVAKVTCSQVFVGGLSAEAAVAELPDMAVTRLIRTRVDVADGRVVARVPGLAAREARYHEGLGCTLVPTTGAMAAFPVMAEALPLSDTEPWPLGHRVDPVMPDDVDVARLEAALDRAFAEPDTTVQRNTRAVLVVHRGRIIAERYAEGFGPRTRFPGWSMTKSVGSALVGVLVGAGQLSLDSASLFPGWRGAGDERAAITLR